MNKKILIVDDDSGVGDSFAMLLRGEGYLVDYTNDSREGAIMAKKDRYDLCVFDYKMAHLNGVELLKITKKANPGCRVFIISGMLDIEKLKIDAGLADGVIGKPFDVEALLQRIAAIV